MERTTEDSGGGNTFKAFAKEYFDSQDPANKGRYSRREAEIEAGRYTLEQAQGEAAKILEKIRENYKDFAPDKKHSEYYCEQGESMVERDYLRERTNKAFEEYLDKNTNSEKVKQEARRLIKLNWARDLKDNRSAQIEFFNGARMDGLDLDADVMDVFFKGIYMGKSTLPIQEMERILDLLGDWKEKHFRDPSDNDPQYVRENYPFIHSFTFALHNYKINEARGERGLNNELIVSDDGNSMIG